MALGRGWIGKQELDMRVPLGVLQCMYVGLTASRVVHVTLLRVMLCLRAGDQKAPDDIYMYINRNPLQHKN